MVEYIRIFRTTIAVSSLARLDERATVPHVMVDTGSEYNALPRQLLLDLGVAPVRVERFESADGRIFEREVGFAIVYAAGRSGATVVIFAEPRDIVLLGAHGLEALNLRIDLGRRELVPAGPAPAAVYRSAA